MGNLIDLTGQTFGEWTVLKKEDLIKSGSNWLCQCSCGTIKIVNGYNLRNGLSTSCGCKKKILAKQMSKNNIIDMTGQKINHWTVLSLSEKKGKSNAKYWLCECDCGTIKEVRGDALRDGSSQSCGCHKKNSHGEEAIIKIFQDNNIKYIKEKIFDNCKMPDTQSFVRFDFYIPDKNYLIEYDGEQHFITNKMPSSKWDTDRIILRDNFKNQWCIENNIPLIRIPYTHFKNLCLEDLLLETSKFIINKEEENNI